MTIRSWFLSAIVTTLFALSIAQAQDVKIIREVVFGSCLDKTEHPMLDQTLHLPMDLFLFLGDNIYADTSDMEVMKAKYEELKKSRFFRAVKQRVPILATWDDHDFGVNDGGAVYPKRSESQQQFWDWLDEPLDSAKRRQAGVYQSAIFGPVGKRVQVIMLDTRYFRSPLKKGKHSIVPSGGEYVPEEDPSSTMLGSEQWRWLETQLRQPAELRLIASSVQFVPTVHGGECWANFPHERQRMLDVLERTRAAGVVFLSGDRHWCEFSRMTGPIGYPLYDFTASSMTQIHPRGTPTPNGNRFLAKTYHKPNVGRLSVNWDREDPRLSFQILDETAQVQLSHDLTLSELQPR